MIISHGTNHLHIIPETEIVESMVCKKYIACLLRLDVHLNGMDPKRAGIECLPATCHRAIAAAHTHTRLSKTERKK